MTSLHYLEFCKPLSIFWPKSRGTRPTAPLWLRLALTRNVAVIMVPDILESCFSTSMALTHLKQLLTREARAFTNTKVSAGRYPRRNRKGISDSEDYYQYRWWPFLDAHQTIPPLVCSRPLQRKLRTLPSLLCWRPTTTRFSSSSSVLLPDRLSLMITSDRWCFVQTRATVALSLVTKYLLKNRLTKYSIQTSQALDIINGGLKSNALPEEVSAVINFRVSIDSVLRRLRRSCSVTHKTLLPFTVWVSWLTKPLRMAPLAWLRLFPKRKKATLLSPITEHRLSQLRYQWLRLNMGNVRWLNPPMFTKTLRVRSSTPWSPLLTYQRWKMTLLLSPLVWWQVTLIRSTTGTYRKHLPFFANAFTQHTDI